MDAQHDTLAPASAARRPSRVGRTPKAQGTHARIIAAATDVLAEEGHAGFSIPRVARAAGVFQGNVTYYFPTREHLLVALTDHIVQTYRTELHGCLAGIDPTADAWVEGFIGWIVDTSVTPYVVSIVPELWSIANRHPMVAERVTRMYEEVAAEVATATGLDPAAPATLPFLVAVTACVQTAIGGIPVLGHRPPGDTLTASVRAAALALHAPPIRAAHRAALRGG
ncbi:MAG: TetR/AcrR family transcriptional regulator [Chloroflexota bacterium]